MRPKDAKPGMGTFTLTTNANPKQRQGFDLQGHSKNPAGYGIDGVGSIFAEIFARGWD
jgi:hypothetical protein